MVEADSQRLLQVFINLLSNARDASPARGTITVSALVTGARVTIHLDDQGTGIPAELVDKVFEPFFTTKKVGEGTGLGLSTAYGIVKQSGGFIFASNVEDEDGEPTGAQFTVYLPVHKGEMPKKAIEAPIEQSSEWSGGGRILLVEDEDMVRAVAQRALSRAGYEVTACSDGEEGLAEITNGSEFDLIVSDVVMPGMDGPTWVRKARETRPDARVVFVSGYTEGAFGDSGPEIANSTFLPKPFSLNQLTETVHEQLH